MNDEQKEVKDVGKEPGTDIEKVIPGLPEFKHAGSFDIAEMDKQIEYMEKSVQLFLRSKDMSKVLISHCQGSLPDGETEDKLTLKLFTGASLGVPAHAAISGIYIVRQNTYVSSKLATGLIKRSMPTSVLKIEEANAKFARGIAWRPGYGEPVSFISTYEDGYGSAPKYVPKGGTKSGNVTWEMNPVAMNIWRCYRFLWRMVFPDQMAGLGITDVVPDIKNPEKYIESEIVSEAIEEEKVPDIKRPEPVRDGEKEKEKPKTTETARTLWSELLKRHMDIKDRKEKDAAVYRDLQVLCMEAQMDNPVTTFNDPNEEIYKPLLDGFNRGILDA